jgi:hypothetical protein
MFRPNWPSSGVQFVGKTAARCHAATLCILIIKYFKISCRNYFFLHVFLVLCTICWCVGFSLALSVAVLNVSCRWFSLHVGGRVCMLLTANYFLQHSEYWVTCVNQWVCHSCVIYFYWFCVCRIFLVCLIVFLFSVFVWCPLYLLWSRMYVPCVICDLYIPNGYYYF